MIKLNIPVDETWSVLHIEAGTEETSLLLNLTLTIIGTIFMVVLAANYRKWFGVGPFTPRGDKE